MERNIIQSLVRLFYLSPVIHIHILHTPTNRGIALLKLLSYQMSAELIKRLKIQCTSSAVGRQIN